MEPTIIFLFCIAALPVLIFLLKVLEKREIQRIRKKDIERGMRQAIVDAETEKQVAAKLLREAGKIK